MKKLLRLTVLCGVVPLVVGIAIFVAWALTGAQWLILAGLLTLKAGACSIIVGTVLLIIYVASSWQRPGISRRRLVGQGLAVLGLYGVSVVVAAGAAIGGVMLISRYTVVVANQSHTPLQSVRIEGGGVGVDLGDVPPGGTVRESFWIEHDGELVLTGRHGPNDVTAIVDGYVTNGIGAHREVVLDADGVITVSER